MKIKELHPRLLVSVERSESLESATKLLTEEDIGALVVYEPGGLAGVISERDIVRAVADGADLAETQVGDYMTESPVTADEEGSLLTAIEKMNESSIRHIVVTSDGEVTGMISMRDVVATLTGNRSTL